MRTQNELPHLSRHYISDLDNHILVENHGGDVVIHASRDNFPEYIASAFVLWWHKGERPKTAAAPAGTSSGMATPPLAFKQQRGNSG